MRKYKISIQDILNNNYPNNSRFIICELGPTGEVSQEQYISKLFTVKNESGLLIRMQVETVNGKFINCKLDYYGTSWCFLCEPKDFNVMTKEEFAQHILQELFDSREFIENDYYPVIQASKILEIANKFNLTIKE